MEKMGEQVGLSSDITGEGDVVAWLNKLELVAKLQKTATLIPMYLKGNALVVYVEIGKKDQADAEGIEKILKMAFSEGVFEAYNKLRTVTWTREPVDIYAAD